MWHLRSITDFWHCSTEVRRAAVSPSAIPVSFTHLVYTIPLALSKRQGVNQWFYGSEAIRYAGEEEGILVENLLKLARDGEPVQIDGAPIDPVALLTLFLKRSLGLLSQVTNTERIGALMITCEELDLLSLIHI